MDKEYLRLVEESKRNFLKLNRDQYKQIRDIYVDASRDMERKAVSSKSGSLTQRWAMDYKKSLDRTIREMNKELFQVIKKDMEAAAEIGVFPQISLFDFIGRKYSIDVTEKFSMILSKAPNEALKELIEGGFYKDGRGLSSRLWINGRKLSSDIDYIIQRGIAEKKSAYELAKDLESYVNPGKRKDFNWGKAYPNLAGKKVDYNAQRLARTSISHAYTLSLIKGCKKNPYVDGIQWYSVMAHQRTCSLCKERHMKIFSVDDCPVDHPNGLCTQMPIITKSLDEIGKELGDWGRGQSNSVLDSWYREYGKDFAV